MTNLVIAGHPGPGRQRIAEALQLRRLERPYGRLTLQWRRPKLRTSALRDPDRPTFDRFALVLGILVGVAVGQVALADYEERAAMQAEPISTPESVAAPISTPESVAAPISTPETAAVPLTAPQVYKAVCIACHAAPGVGGAPALGDGAAWAARIAQGMDSLIDHALHGFSGSAGIMPRKGGRIDLSDEEIIGAVEYMVEQAEQVGQ